MSNFSVIICFSSQAKSKKSARKKVLRVDTALLGFNVTAAPDRINIGERDMGEDVY